MSKREQISIHDLLHFTDKQVEARKRVLKFKYLLYGGAMAGGKSYWLRWMLMYLLVRWADQGFKKVEVGLFCEDYPTLKDRQLSKIGTEFPAWLGTMHGDHVIHGRCYILADEYGGGIIKFRNLDDPSKYQSAEFAAIGVDELTKNPGEVFEDLRNRLRWPGIADVRFLGATNPGGVGHAWVKKLWLDRIYDENEQEREQFYYVRALVADNPYTDKNYSKQLESLPIDKRRAYLEGDWDIFKGQFFTEWRREIHTCTPFEVPLDWKRIVSIDYGYTAPASMGWYAIDPSGFHYRYREVYVTEHTGSMLGAKFVEHTNPNERIDHIVADPSFWAKKGESDNALSAAEKFEAKVNEILKPVERRCPPMIRANNDRVQGWLQVHEMLKPIEVEGQLTSKFKVFTTCPDFIRTVPGLVHDTNNPEDVDSDGEDHAGDDFRYYVMDRPKPSVTAAEKELAIFNKAMSRKKQRNGQRKLLFVQ